jgi:ABC-type nitrate/sulfonate/bicarbonate transport system substrate-binding protein
MKKFASRAVSITALLLSFLLIGFASLSRAESGPQGESPQLTVGVYPTPYTRLIAIAGAKDYFKKCGVEVSIRKYPSGTSALDALVNGAVEMATVVDFRFAWEMLKDAPIRVVASQGEVFEGQIVARKDRGIWQPSDLKGKRIGFVPNTISEFALQTFLLENNISPSEVVAVPISLLDQTDAVIDGRVDAVSAFVTFAFDAVDRLGENGVAWDSRYHLVYNALLVVKEGMLQSPKAISLFLKSLIMAETFCLTHEDEAKRIVMKEWGFSANLLDQFWAKTKVGVSLNQSVITSLKIYSKWLMRRNEMKGQPPNVMKFIDSVPLDQIAPDRVTIFR